LSPWRFDFAHKVMTDFTLGSHDGGRLRSDGAFVWGWR
jgi:hypothetical protein